MKKLLDGGKMTLYGAKAIPEGGWFSMPHNAGDGFLVIGDSGHFLNGQKLKGVHLAMKSGMLAAETIFEALKEGGIDAARLLRFEEKVEQSWIKDEMWPTRNFHQAFDYGTLGGMINTGLGMVTGGRGWGFKNKLEAHPGHERMVKLDSPEGRGMKERPRAAIDNKLTFDKLGDVYNSGTAHEEEQPVHLLVADPEHCVRTCLARIRQPLPALLPGRGLRNRRRRHPRDRQAAADQRQQLRALQNLRHHGPLPDHHLGAPRRRRRAFLQQDVGTRGGAGCPAPPRRSLKAAGGGGSRAGA